MVVCNWRERSEKYIVADKVSVAVEYGYFIGTILFRVYPTIHCYHYRLIVFSYSKQQNCKFSWIYSNVMVRSKQVTFHKTERMVSIIIYICFKIKYTLLQIHNWCKVLTLMELMYLSMKQYKFFRELNFIKNFIE